MDTVKIKIPEWNLDKLKKTINSLKAKGYKLLMSDTGRGVENIDGKDYLVHNITIVELNGKDISHQFSRYEFNGEKVMADTEKFGRFLGYNTERVIRLGLNEIGANGYVNAQLDGSTKSKVQELYDDSHAYLASDAEYEHFSNWLNNYNAKSDYERSAKMACQLEYCQGRDLGYILSFISKYFKEAQRAETAYQRELQRAKEAAVSNYLGKAGDKVVFTVTSSRALYTIEPYTYNGEYKTAYRIIDENGNIIIWKTPYVVHDGDIVQATIKSVGVYRGEKQTTVIRGKILNYVDDANPDDDGGPAIGSLLNGFYDVID